jgi:hypothetical protein
LGNFLPFFIHPTIDGIARNSLSKGNVFLKNKPRHGLFLTKVDFKPDMGYVILCGVITPFSPPSGPAQRLLQGSPAKSKFLAVQAGRRLHGSLPTLEGAISDTSQGSLPVDGQSLSGGLV